MAKQVMAALVVLLAGCLAGARAGKRDTWASQVQPAFPSRAPSSGINPADGSIQPADDDSSGGPTVQPPSRGSQVEQACPRRPSETGIIQVDIPVQEQTDAPPAESSARARRHEMAEPGRSLGDSGEILPETNRWLGTSPCIKGPAAAAMPITAPDGCQSCERPGCGQCRGIKAVLRFFTYYPIQRGACLQCCSACGFYHSYVPVYLYMRWPCRESCGARMIQPPCSYPSACFRKSCKGCNTCTTCGQGCNVVP